jgi:methionyl-tRNA synthetase
MRLGIDQEYKLPDYIPTRGHLTLQSKKISKSRNWYIGLREFLDNFPADYLRYYLVSINPYSQDDLNFDWDDFATRINSELIANLGNLVNRALGFTQKSFSGVVPTPDKYDEKDKEADSKIRSLAAELAVLMEQNHLDRALKKVMEFSIYFNQYFQHKEPWKNGPGTNTCMFLTVNAVFSLAVAAFPFIPRSAQRIWEQLGMEGKVVDSKWGLMSDVAVKPGHKIGRITPLFLRIEEADIAKHKEKLGSK